MTPRKSILALLILISVCFPFHLLRGKPFTETKITTDSLSINSTSELENSQSIQSATGKADEYPYTLKSITSDDWLTIDDVTPELSPEGRIPLLLIHGWNFGDQIPTPPGFGYWEYFKNFLLNDPELRKYFKLYYVKYWSNAVSVNQLGGLLRDKIEQAGLHEQPLVLIGHSMGGLVSRSFMNEYSFNTGIHAGEKCGELVKLLITLGSPHHGSPMANGPARNDRISNILLKLILPSLDRIVFSETKYNEVNRSDLRWDNYDNLFNYTKFPDDKNDWLSNMNTQTIYDQKLICYSASVTGVFRTNPSGVDEQYQTGSYLMKESFGFENDGIVPVQSSSFTGHTPKKIRSFSEYNHADIVKGKADGLELFNPLKEDLLEVVPPQIIWPSEEGIFAKHNQTRTISWDAPSSVQNVNIYFSGDNGQSYSLLANNINASLTSFQWSVPDTNLTQCLIKITNASNENLFTCSENPFTIYHNNVTIEIPAAKTYFTPNQAIIISWQQYGIDPKVRLTYHDPKNNFEKVIAEEFSVNQQSNTYNWENGNSILSTDSAYITIELLEMNELYGDDENYTYSSSPFMILGLPSITITEPSTYPKDEFGILGEKMIIDTYYTIRWQTEGEIKYVRISLCDSSKNFIREIRIKNHQPGIHSNGFTSWKIPKIYGDKFYLRVEGGPSQNTYTASTYSQYPFRINRNISITNPLAGSNEVLLLPCSEVEPVIDATNYIFEIKDSLTNGTEYDRTFRSASPNLCLPNVLENELLPGMVYNFTTWALFDTIKSYSSRLFFHTSKEKPLSFQTLLPSEGDTIEGISLTYEWNRAVGASEYQIDILNQGNLLTSKLFGRSDTVVSLSIGKSGRPDTLFWKVTARNDFGETITESYFFKKNRTDINQFKVEQNKNNYLVNYPNPFETETTIEYQLPVSNKIFQTEIDIYNLNGQKIRTISMTQEKSGNHKAIWDGKDESGTRVEKGIYFGCLTVNNESVIRSIILK